VWVYQKFEFELEFEFEKEDKIGKKKIKEKRNCAQIGPKLTIRPIPCFLSCATQL
jgi:hypothetical protein